MQITEITDTFFTVYIYSIVAAYFLSWVPGLNWDIVIIKGFWYFVGPFMEIFQIFIPNIAGVDVSPILAIGFLWFVKRRTMLYFIDFINCAKINNTEDEENDENQDT